jgi:hypothetical protein
LDFEKYHGMLYTLPMNRIDVSLSTSAPNYPTAPSYFPSRSDQLTDSILNSSSPSEDSSNIIYIESLFTSGATGIIYKGTILDFDVIIKNARQGFEGYLRHEAYLYENYLGDIIGKIVPMYFGIFTGNSYEVLVLEDCGERINSFEELTLEAR